MPKRINIILADATLNTIDRLSSRGQRSRFIERAVQHYLRSNSPQVLQECLKQPALRDRDLDLEIAADWDAVNQQRQFGRGRQKRPPHRSVMTRS